jgi:hypothetical protein
MGKSLPIKIAMGNCPFASPGRATDENSEKQN